MVTQPIVISIPMTLLDNQLALVVEINWAWWCVSVATFSVSVKMGIASVLGAIWKEN